MPEIIWASDMPREIRAAVEPILEFHRHLIPSWCHRLFIEWRDGGSEDGTTAASSAWPEYRHATIYIHPGFLAQRPEDREQDIVHEMLHIPLAPMVSLVKDLLTRLLEEGNAPQFHGFSQEQWRLAYEGTVQDLAHSLARGRG